MLPDKPIYNTDVFLIFCLFLAIYIIGNARCTQEVRVGSTLVSTAIVNTSVVPTCFTCLDNTAMPAFRPSLFIASNMIPLNAEVTQTAHQLFVANFISLPLLRDGILNQFRCLASDGALLSRNVATLSELIIMSLLLHDPSIAYILYFHCFILSLPTSFLSTSQLRSNSSGVFR